MASRKEYTYQIKGNKLSLLEKDYSTGSGLGLAGVSTDGTQYGTSGDGLTDDIPSGTTVVKSPLSSVTDGIEIEYAYSPTYTLPTKRTDSGTADTYHLYNGWFVVDGYLTIGATNKDFVNDATITVNSHILIEGSSRWNGIHKVQAVQDILGGSHGGIQTYTKVSESTNYFTDSSCSWTTSETITGVSAEFSKAFSTSPSDTQYIWLAGSDAHHNNNGLFSNWSFAGTTITLSGAKWYTSSGLDESVYDVPTDPTEAFTQVDGAHPLYAYEAFRETGGAKFYSSVSILEDESSEMDISSYLSKALVYYVKAKVAEDTMNIEVKEYMMREFRKMLEKHENSKVAGPRMIMPGPNALR